MTSYKKKIIAMAKWTSSLRYLTMMINFGGGIYLARTIAPEIFGQVGLLMAIIAMLTQASAWGFGPAILGRPGSAKDNIEYLGTLLTIEVSISVIITIILMLIALALRGSMGLILAIMTLGTSLKLITAIYRATVIKDGLFHHFFIINIVSVFCAMFAACFLAYRGFGIWALVAKYVIEEGLIAVLSFLIVPYWIKFRFNRKTAKEFFNFGKYAFASSIIEGGTCNFDKISVGSFIGSATLGFYERAHRLATYANAMFFAALSPMFESVFGKFKDDRLRLSKAYNLGSCFFVRLYMLFFVWLGLLIPEGISIVYGEKWLPAVPIFRLLMPYIIFTGLRKFNRTLQLTTGHSKVVAKIQIIELISFALCLCGLLFWLKVQVVIMALNVSTTVGLIAFLVYAKRIVDVQLKKIFLAPILNSIITLAVFYHFEGFFRNMGNIYMYVTVSSLTILGTYLILSLVLEYKFTRYLFSYIRSEKNG